MGEKEFQKEILELEDEVKRLETTINAIKQRIVNLKDLAWDKQSKKESSSMYKVLKEDKTHTMVKSDVGDIKVDKDFMEKEITKHLDNPNLRGMVTTKEMLSFPKAAKGVKAKFNDEHKDFTWRVKANDESILIYGSREYIQNNETINRLLTAHSKTEYGERKEIGGSGQTKSALPPLFNDSDFRKSANKEIITQNKEYEVNKKDTNMLSKQNSLVETPTPSTHRSKSAGELIGKNLSGVNAHSANFDNNMPQPLKESQAKNDNLEAKVSELLREQESISSMLRAKDFNKNFQKDLEESFGMKLEDLKDESKNKPTYTLLRKR